MSAGNKKNKSFKKNKRSPQRQSRTYGSKGSRNTVPRIEPRHFGQSYHVDRRVPIELLRSAMRTSPVRRAIERITDGIFAMTFDVLPPKGKEGKEQEEAIAESIKESLSMPNWDDDETYHGFLFKVISELLGLGFACIEKQRGDNEKPIWLWVADSSRIHVNPDWTPGSGEPRYFEKGRYTDTGSIGKKAFTEDEMFVIQKVHATYEMVPPSPVEIAFPHICAWLGLHNFQHDTTSRATSQYMLDLGDVSREELDSFREYWKKEIEGTGNTPIAAGKGQMRVEKVGARNDSELFHQYDEKLLRRIAFSFNLTARDYGLTDHDNRATAGVAADSAFQEAILPYAYCFFGSLNVHLLDRWYPGYRIEINDTEPRTESQEGKLASDLYKAGLLTLNEARRRIGAEDLGDRGNTFKDGSTLDDPTPANQKQAQPPGQGGMQPPPTKDKNQQNGGSKNGQNGTTPLRENKEKKDTGSKIEQQSQNK